MRKLLSLALPLLLASCAAHTPAPSEWSGTLWGKAVTWRIVAPGSIQSPPGRHFVGYATSDLLAGTCLVEVDAAALVRAPETVPHLVAHEVGHCAQGWFLLLGLPRPDLGEYYAGYLEGWAETYALAYLRACGSSLAPLGWNDGRPAACAAPPDPREVRAAF